MLSGPTGGLAAVPGVATYCQSSIHIIRVAAVCDLLIDGRRPGCCFSASELLQLQSVETTQNKAAANPLGAADENASQTRVSIARSQRLETTSIFFFSFFFLTLPPSQR